MLRIEGIGKSFSAGGRNRTVFHDVSLDVQAGEIVAIFGPNGVGKSTLLRCVAGLLTPDFGTIELDLRDNQFRSRVGYLFDGPKALRPRLTAEENIAYFQGILGIDDRKFCDDAMGYAVRLGLTALDRPLQMLSKGSQQKVNIAMGLAARPGLLVCDEPSSFLDEAASTSLAEAIKEAAADGAHVIAATHNRNFAHRMNARQVRLTADGIENAHCDAGIAIDYLVSFHDCLSREQFIHASGATFVACDERAAKMSAAAMRDLLPYLERGEVRGLTLVET